jgi:hypothetical protein
MGQDLSQAHNIQIILILPCVASRRPHLGAGDAVKGKSPEGPFLQFPNQMAGDGIAGGFTR